MAFGIDVSELDDLELAALCSQATTWVNRYCLVPRLPQMHDFRGGSITGEQHQWRYPETPFDIGQRKAFPLHWPIKDVTDFRIKVTNTQYVGIDPSDLFINNGLKYVEVVSLALTSAGLFNALVIPNIGLATPVVQMNYDYGWDFEESGEILMPDDGQTYRSQNQWWATTPTPVITVNGLVATTGFTINYDEGTVTFAVDQTPGEYVTAAYHHNLPSEIQWATGHIVAWLHAEAEMHARGMAHLQTMNIGEVKMQRPRSFAFSSNDLPDLDSLVPEAAQLLKDHRFDGASIR